MMMKNRTWIPLLQHRNGSMLTEFLVNEVIMGKLGMGSEYVDGFYIDDGCVQCG